MSLNMGCVDAAVYQLQLIDTGKISMQGIGLNEMVGTGCAVTQCYGCLFTDLKAARPDTGAEGCDNMLAVGAVADHLIYGGCDNTRGGASPAGMNGGDDPGDGVGQQHGQTISGTYCNGCFATPAEQDVSISIMHAAATGTPQVPALVDLPALVGRVAQACAGEQSFDIDGDVFRSVIRICSEIQGVIGWRTYAAATGGEVTINAMRCE